MTSELYNLTDTKTSSILIIPIIPKYLELRHKREERKETLQTKIDLLNLSVGKTWHFRRALRKYAISLILCSTASCTMGPKFFFSSILNVYSLYFIYFINKQTTSNWQLPKYGCCRVTHSKVNLLFRGSTFDFFVVWEVLSVPEKPYILPI